MKAIILMLVTVAFGVAEDCSGEMCIGDLSNSMEGSAFVQTKRIDAPVDLELTEDNDGGQPPTNDDKPIDAGDPDGGHVISKGKDDAGKDDAEIDDGDQDDGEDHFPDEDDKDQMLVETVDLQNATSHRIEIKSRSNTSESFSVKCYLWWTYGGARRRGRFTYRATFMQTDQYGDCPHSNYDANDCGGDRAQDVGSFSLVCNNCYNYQRSYFKGVKIEFTGQSWAWLDRMTCGSDGGHFGVAGGGHWKFDATGKQYRSCRKFINAGQWRYGHAEAC